MEIWLDPIDDLPDWKDSERLIWGKYEDGSNVFGKLSFDEFTSGPDECPLWHIKQVKGDIKSFYDLVSFTYLTHRL